MATITININNKNNDIHKFLLILFCIAWQFNAAIAQDLLPHPCDSVKCPPLSEMTCPEDSEIRDTSLASISLVQAITSAPPLSTSTVTTTTAREQNTTLIDDESYAQCCLAKKCLCKTCYIPDCHEEGQVVVELQPESMDTPGHCCGQYECRHEPNCTEIRDTDYWRTNCQRCKCYSGERICHQSCDEDAIKKPAAVCNSKSMNNFYEHGDTWKFGCYDCECVNGEEKCVMPFCRSLNCPPKRQVMLKDSCCPVCWPKGSPIPKADGDYIDEMDDDDDYETQESGGRIYDDEDDDNVEPVVVLPHDHDDSENEIDTLPNIQFNNLDTSTEQATHKNTAAPADAEPVAIADLSTASTESNEAPSSTSSPCLLDARHDAPATYQVYPEVVEVVRQTHQNDILYIVIFCLAVFSIALVGWNIRLRAKQRSYRPVSNFDDNFNKKTPNIKKMNEYV